MKHPSIRMRAAQQPQVQVELPSLGISIMIDMMVPMTLVGLIIVA